MGRQGGAQQRRMFPQMVTALQPIGSGPADGLGQRAALAVEQFDVDVAGVALQEGPEDRRQAIERGPGGLACGLPDLGQTGHQPGVPVHLEEEALQGGDGLIHASTGLDFEQGHAAAVPEMQEGQHRRREQPEGQKRFEQQGQRASAAASEAGGPRPGLRRR